MPASDIHRVIDAVWRIESARVIGGLARIVRDVGVAEDLAQDALVAALKQWPESGVPDNPAAWLMGAAKHRAIDHLRRRQLLERKHDQLAYETPGSHDATAEIEQSLDDDVGDDLLRLIFAACHPVLPAEARSALTLRFFSNPATTEIARAYLTSEPTIAQRIVRAKKTLAAKRVPFEVPRGSDRAVRLASEPAGEAERVEAVGAAVRIERLGDRSAVVVGALGDLLEQAGHAALCSAGSEILVRIRVTKVWMTWRL